MRYSRLLILGVLSFSLSCSDPVDDQTDEWNWIVEAQPEIRAKVGEQIAFNVVAENPDGSREVNLKMTKGPAGANFLVSVFGRFSWTPEAKDASAQGTRHDVIFHAEDSKGRQAEYRQAIIVEPSEGETRFTTSNNRVLDLTRATELRANVAVQRPDVSEVTLSLDGEPEGMSIEQTGAKSATLRWQPSDGQVGQKLIWGARVVADAGDGNPVEQNLSVTLVRKACGEGATEIEHTPLAEQRIAGNYGIEATIQNPAGGINATLFWRAGGDPNDSGGFEGVPMESTGGDNYAAVIPNPNAEIGEPLDVYYFIVAFSEADRDNLGCVARAPEVGLNSFAAFAAGDESCREDKFEPNNSFDGATVISEETVGVTLASGQIEAYGLAICDGDRDIYAFQLEENQGVVALITYNGDVGQLHLTAYGPDEEIITESDDALADESSLLLAAPTSGTYYIEVSGDRNEYRGFLSLRDNVDPSCVDNALEPNESAQSAIVVNPDAEAQVDGWELVLDDLRICPGDKDFFGVNIPAGLTLTVTADFDHDNGDLDLVLTDRDGQRVGGSFLSEDHEEFFYANHSGPGSHTLEVRAIGDNINSPYELGLRLDEIETEECDRDFFEPNDTPQQVQNAVVDGDLDFGARMCGDDDYYAFQVESGQTLTATITFDSQIADLDMEVLDQDLSVRESASTSSGEERIAYEAERTGLHYVRVFRTSRMGVPDYRISVTVGGGQQTGDCADADPNEPNDGSGAAVNYDDAEIEGVGLCAGDADWYVVMPTPNSVIAANIEGIPVDDGDFLNDVRLEIIGADGETVLATGEQFQDSLDAQSDAVLSSEPHYVRVTSISGNAFLYDIVVFIF